MPHLLPSPRNERRPPSWLPCLRALATFATFAAAPAFAGPPPATGNAIVAKPGGNALLIWDASADVATIVTARTPDADARVLLERAALRVLAASLAKLDGTAATITLRVVYDKIGAVSPVYGAATFAGVERYATLELSAKDARADRDGWRELAATGRLPKWIAFDVTGRLPPN